MSLFSTVQVSSNALRVNQLGLQVVSNNIANANTPGYVRQELIQQPAIGYRLGGSIVGQGVQAVGVRQTLDDFVLQRMRDVQSQLSQSQGLQESNGLIEDAINELGDNDLSSSMSRFSNAMQDVANQPGNASLRTLAVKRGQELAADMNRLSDRVTAVAGQANDQVDDVASEINRLTSSLANLNRRIVEIEGGELSTSDAVGLRDERLKALDELSKLVNIQAIEQSNGSVTVLVGGDYLVTDGLSREVETRLAGSADGRAKEVIISDSDAPLIVTGGKLKGIYETRDGSAQRFLGRLDYLAKQMIQQINRIHSQGQGSQGFTETTGDIRLTSPGSVIENAGEGIEIDNGSFVVTVRDATTGVTRTTDIFIKQQGGVDDTSVNDLMAQLNGVSGIQASLSADGLLQIRSASPAIRFSFGQDTSGAVSALGLNNFFSGDSAATMAVRSEVVSDPSRLAVSLNGPGGGAGNAIALAEAFDQASAQLNGQTLREGYESLVVDTTQEISSQKAVTDGLANFYQSLEAKHLGISGVSLDEEGIKMLLYQRAFQASSRVIATANEMLQTLVTMV